MPYNSAHTDIPLLIYENSDVPTHPSQAYPPTRLRRSQSTRRRLCQEHLLRYIPKKTPVEPSGYYPDSDVAISELDEPPPHASRGVLHGKLDGSVAAVTQHKCLERRLSSVDCWEHQGLEGDSIGREMKKKEKNIKQKSPNQLCWLKKNRIYVHMILYTIWRPNVLCDWLGEWQTPSARTAQYPGQTYDLGWMGEWLASSTGYILDPVLISSPLTYKQTHTITPLYPHPHRTQRLRRRRAVWMTRQKPDGSCDTPLGKWRSRADDHRTADPGAAWLWAGSRVFFIAFIIEFAKNK